MRPLFLFLLAATVAGPAEPLTLQQAVELALQRNQDVLKAREQAKAMQGKIREVRSQALPQFKIEASAVRFRDPSFLNSSSFDKIPEDFRRAISPVPANLFDYALTFSQPIYTAGKVGTAVRLASLELEGVNSDVDRVERDVSLDVIRTFYALLLARERVALARETVAQRQKHLDVVRARFQAGDATEVDVLRSEVNLANAQPDLIGAENAVEQARAALNHLLVREAVTPVEAAGNFPYDAWREWDIDTLAREAVRRRPEISRLRIVDRESELNLKLAEAENRTRVDFRGRYGISSRLAGNLADSQFTRWSTSLEFVLPVFDGGRRSGLITQALATKNSARLSLLQQESATRLQVQQALDEVRRAEKVVEAAQATVRQAERVRSMMQNNYRYGAATTLDVVDAQTAYTLARTNLLQGLHDHATGTARLRWVLGRPLLPGKGGTP